MALKTVIESLDDVPEALHAEYVEKEGKFVLDIEGVDAHPTVVNLKTAFERVKADKKKLSSDLDEAKGKLAEVPDDFDAEEWVRLKAEAGDPNDPDRKKPTDEHLQSQKRLYEQRIANLEKKYADELKTKEGEIAERDNVISTVLVEDGLTKALVEAGIDKQFLKAARAMLKPSVKVIRDDDGTRRAVVETDMGEDDVGKFVTNWAQSDEGKVFVAKPTGGDAKGGQGRSFGENPFDTQGGKVRPNLTKQQELISTNPEKARQLAKAAGVTPTW